MAPRLVALIKAVPDLANLSVSRSQQMVFERSGPILPSVSEEVLEFSAQLKEICSPARLTAVMVGEKTHNELVKHSFLFGSDDGVLISCASAALDHFTKAKILAAYLKNLPDTAVVVCGPASGNTGGGGQLGPRLAAELSWEHVSQVRSVRLEEARAVVTVSESGAAAERPVSLPVLVVLQNAVTTPRIPSAVQIMKAASKAISEVAASSLGFDDPEKMSVARVVRRVLIEHGS